MDNHQHEWEINFHDGSLICKKKKCREEIKDAQKYFDGLGQRIKVLEDLLQKAFATAPIQLQLEIAKAFIQEEVDGK